MSNKLKRALSSILAFTMVLSMITVMNVNNVFASTVTTKWDFSSGGDGNEVAVDSTISDTTGQKNIIVKASKVVRDSSDLNLKANSIIWIPINSETTSITLSDYSVNAGSDRYVLVGKSKSTNYKLANIAKSTSYSVTISNLTDELEEDGEGNKYLPVTSYGNYKTQYFELVETIPGDAPDVENIYIYNDGVNVTDSDINVYLSEPIQLSVVFDPSSASDTINWSSSASDKASVEDGKVTALSSGHGVTITATTSGGKTASVTIHTKADPVVAASSGSELVAATETKIYDFLSEAVNAGAITGSYPYEKSKYYFDNEIYVYNGGDSSTGLLYYSNKSSVNIDGTKNSGGLRLKAGQDIFSVKLAAGATINIPVYGGGGGDRYGIIATSSSASATTDASVVASTDNIGTTNGSNPKTLTYTNETGAEQVVYVTATGDTFFSQVQVVVPETEEATDYYYAYFTEDDVANAVSFSIVNTETDTVVADSEGNTEFDTVYSDVDLDGDGIGNNVEIPAEYKYVVAFIVTGADENADIQNHFKVQFNTADTAE